MLLLILIQESGRTRRPKTARLHRTINRQQVRGRRTRSLPEKAPRHLSNGKQSSQLVPQANQLATNSRALLDDLVGVVIRVLRWSSIGVVLHVWRNMLEFLLVRLLRSPESSGRTAFEMNIVSGPA